MDGTRRLLAVVAVPPLAFAAVAAWSVARFLTAEPSGGETAWGGVLLVVLFMQYLVPLLVVLGVALLAYGGAVAAGLAAVRRGGTAGRFGELGLWLLGGLPLAGAATIAGPSLAPGQAWSGAGMAFSFLSVVLVLAGLAGLMLSFGSAVAARRRGPAAGE